jgi:secreted Zn-dependent insulinase-like peptidase
MDTKEYEKNCRSLSKELLEEPKNLKIESTIYNAVIASHQFNFDNFVLDAEIILQIQKSDLIDFFKRLCLAGPERVKLSAHIKSQKCPKEYDQEVNQAMQQIESQSVLLKTHEEIAKFKETLSLGGTGSPARPIEVFYKF